MVPSLDNTSFLTISDQCMLADTDAWQERVLLLLQDSNEELTAAGTHDINEG